MKFEIKRARNGWICQMTDDHPDGETETIVGEEVGACEHENFRRFLQEMIQVYGPSDSRYHDKRLRVVMIPGDKNEGPLENEHLKDLAELCVELLRDLHHESERRKRVGGGAMPTMDFEDMQLLLRLAGEYVAELNKMVN